MQAKPKHLEPQYAAQFNDPAIVAAYDYRPPYAPEVFAVLLDLMTDAPRVVLDVGTGTGKLARGLAPHVDRVDALDWSANMIDAARQRPGGHHAHLRWIVGRAEDAPLDPPYALITAGASLHWMDWAIVMPRFATMLTPHGMLAITGENVTPVPWEYGSICAHYSTNRDYQPYNLIDELQQRHLFDQIGAHTTQPVPFRQSIADYIESFHARNGLSRDRMTPANAAAFDAEIRELVTPYAIDGQLELHLQAQIVWGKPGQ